VAYFLVFKEHLRNPGDKAVNLMPQGLQRKRETKLFSIVSVLSNIENYSLYCTLKYRIAFSKR